MRATGRTRLLRLLILSLTLTALFGATSPAPAAAATSLKVCGTVTTYVKASVLVDGVLVVGVTPLVIKKGAVLDSDIKAGANLCLDLTLDLSGKVTNAVVRASVTAELRICGDVTAYVKATATSAGSLRIAGRTLTLAAGSTLPAAVKVGADLCLDLTLDAFGQVKNGTATVNADVHVKICGEVTGYAAASLTNTGSLTIAGRKFILGLGSSLPAAVRVGADLCVDLTLNGFGQVSNGTATANVDAHVRLCGVVTAYSAATLTSTGHLAVAGKSFVLGLGSKLPAAVRAGADLCLDLTVNVFGQVSGGTAVVNAHATLEVCGQVTAYVKPTSTTNGRLAVGNQDRTIAAGSSLDAAVKAGAYLRLRLTVDAFGRVSDAVVLKVGASLAQACTNAAPTPTPTPTPTPGSNPTPTPTPAATPNPTPVGATPTPSPTPTDGATPSPTPAATPTPTPTDNASPTHGVDASPSGGVAGATLSPDSCVPGSAHSDGSNGSNGGTGTEAGGDGTVGLPDTASLGRTGTLLAATSVPLMLGLGALFGSLMQRRRMSTVAIDADDNGEADSGR